MKRFFWTTILLSFAACLPAVAGIVQGVVVDNETKTPLADVLVSIPNDGKTVKTGFEGQFELQNVTEGKTTITFSKNGFEPQSINITVVSTPLVINTEIQRKVEIDDMSVEDNALLFDESMLEDEGAAASQSIAYLTSSSDDPYLSATSYTFSPMRFSLRGYDQRDHATSINGIDFTDSERGRFNYSGIGGLNNATRNKDVVNGLDMTGYSFGSLTGSTNINTYAAEYAAGAHVGLSYTNRSYMLRGQATYATGIMDNGWAFTGSLVYRWADKGRNEGTSYNSFGYFFAAQKIFGDHSIAITTWGAPTERGQSSASTQEVYDYRGIYYNSYWGYQDGKVRNSRIVQSYDPTVIVNYDWKINDRSNLKIGAAYHYNKYSNSALAFYNAPDPRPDYYRNLPSFQYTNLNVNGPEDTDNPFYNDVNTDLYNSLRNEWINNNTDVTQINWAALYQANYLNNAADPSASAHYILERRHNDLMESTLNALYTNQINDKLLLHAGVSGKYGKGMHYKTVDDLLGGNQWIDIDQFAERDFSNNAIIIQNDLDNPNRAVREGDVFGYNYNLNIYSLNAWVVNQYHSRYWDYYYGMKLTYTSFQRDGKMRNGRYPDSSFGKGARHQFTDLMVKGGLTYKFNGRHMINANISYGSEAPLPNEAYVSPRITDRTIDDMKSGRVLSADINYIFSTPHLAGRIGVFQTNFYDQMERNSYYDGIEGTFINHVLYGVNRIHRGIELGATYKLDDHWSFDLAGTVGEYYYSNNPDGIKNSENGKIVEREQVYMKDVYVGGVPQIAGTFGIRYFIKYWFLGANLNGFARNYIEAAPLRRLASSYTEVTPYNQYYDAFKQLTTQERFPAAYTLDLSIGKIFYLPGRQSINFNLSLNNVLNKKDICTGGYEQGRFDLDHPERFGGKYYYMQGINCFLNVSYRF